MESRNSCQLLFLAVSDSSLEWVLQASGYLQRADLPEELLQSSENATEASVLIPLFWHGEEWHVLYIRRVTNQRDRHSGQVAFPGGRRDPIDTDATSVALREAFEEIGLHQHEVEVLQVLPEYRTSSNFIVTPVVGIVPWPYPYRPQPDEVSRIFSIPLNWLANQSNVEVRDRDVTNDAVTATLKVVYYDKYDGELLWGASARMTISLLKALHSDELLLDQ